MELLSENFVSRPRRFFLVALSAIVGGMMLMRRTGSKKPTPETTKFLTQDGKLVQVPIDKLPIAKAIITKDRLVSWIWKHQKL